MRSDFLPRLAIALLLTFSAAVRAYSDGVGDTLVNIKPLSVSTKVDFGEIVHGYNTEGDRDYDGQILQRTGVWFTQETTVGSRLSMKMGVGGVFWYALPSVEGAPHTLLTKFGPGISQAYATYKFGDVNHPSADFQMGLFPYKYNPEASNLGEYLLRSGTYPGYLVTGGWNIINTAFYLVEGLRLGVYAWDGKIKSDFILPMEKDIPPMYDFSPTYVVTVSPSTAVQFGAGIAFNHYLAWHPSQESPRPLQPDDPAHSLNDFIYRTGDVHCHGDTGDGTYCRDTTQQYTMQGIKLMARMTIDPKAFISASFLRKDDLKINLETALLGVTDYPFFYERRADRMPILLGINIPTLGLLDLLSVQAEYYHIQFPNDIYILYQNQLPVWTLRDNDPRTNLPNSKRNKSDQFNWSVLAKRQVVKGINVYAQIANDHLRTFDYNIQLSGQPVTTRLRDWYYLLRLEFGI